VRQDQPVSFPWIVGEAPDFVAVAAQGERGRVIARPQESSRTPRQLLGFTHSTSHWSGGRVIGQVPSVTPRILPISHLRCPLLLCFTESLAKALDPGSRKNRCLRWTSEPAGRLVRWGRENRLHLGVRTGNWPAVRRNECGL